MNFSELEIVLFHSDNSEYEQEWNGTRLNDDYHRLYFIAGGTADVTYDGNDCHLKAGRTYLFPTTRRFDYYCQSHLKLLNVCFKMTVQGGIDILDLHPWNFVYEAPSYDATLQSMTQIDEKLASKGFADQIMVRSQILSLLSPHFNTRAKHRDLKRQQDVRRMAPVLRHVADNLRKGVKVSELHKLAGMSRSHFVRKFQETFDTSPQDYVRKKRIALVKRELFSSELPLSVLAEDLGFSSPSHMSREFKLHTGYAPKDFRELDKIYD
ncbi:MAG: AraC family transcriptional regulator [Roseibium sp.]